MKASSGDFATVIQSDQRLLFDIMTITLRDGTVLRLTNADLPSVWVKDMASGGIDAHEFFGAPNTQ